MTENKTIETHDLNVTVLASLDDQEKAPVTITLSFPKGRGMTAINVLRAVADDDRMLAHFGGELAKTGDAETLASMETAGITHDDVAAAQAAYEESKADNE